MVALCGDLGLQANCLLLKLPWYARSRCVLYDVHYEGVKSRKKYNLEKAVGTLFTSIFSMLSHTVYIWAEFCKCLKDLLHYSDTILTDTSLIDFIDFSNFCINSCIDRCFQGLNFCCDFGDSEFCFCIKIFLSSKIA